MERGCKGWGEGLHSQATLMPRTIDKIPNTPPPERTALLSHEDGAHRESGSLGGAAGCTLPSSPISKALWVLG